MPTNQLFNFDNTYLTLPDKFYSLVQPSLIHKPEIFLLNNSLCDQLDISNEDEKELLMAFLNEHKNFNSFAQAYAGHQFGHFTRLGDGRAIVLGEHITPNKARYDIQLKGPGRTPYSRGGDGKATLKAMLREYLMSEAMHHLNIPTSRSLAVIKTGEPVFRDPMQEGAILVRVMKSHIRVGTFEFAARFGEVSDIKALADYTINRLSPEIANDENPILSLLNKVMSQQIDLVANWMRVGFIHGVMNTDNTAISGETFDYGPCAFMNTYLPMTAYSSIDVSGRYAFGNQPQIILWNIARLAEALLPIIHEDNDQALTLAQIVIDSFNEKWQHKYYGIMLKKIGIGTNESAFYPLIDELLELMKKLKLDYTNTFNDLATNTLSEDHSINDIEFLPWSNKWREIIENTVGMQYAQKVMRQNNPILIPRNHLVEQALDQAVNGDLSLFNKFLKALAQPYSPQEGIEDFTKPSELNFEKSYQTFCGT